MKNFIKSLLVASAMLSGASAWANTPIEKEKRTSGVQERMSSTNIWINSLNISFDKEKITPNVLHSDVHEGTATIKCIIPVQKCDGSYTFVTISGLDTQSGCGALVAVAVLLHDIFCN